MIEQLNESIKAGNPAYVSRAIQPSFGWDTVVGYLTHCADNDVGEPIDILNYRLAGADQIDSVRAVVEYLNENLEKPVLGADLMTTFNTKGNTKYHGENDVVLWNVIGYSNFTIVEEDGNGEQRLLEPGDIVYVPKGIEYTVKPESARAFVLFSLE